MTHKLPFSLFFFYLFLWGTFSLPAQSVTFPKELQQAIDISSEHLDSALDIVNNYREKTESKKLTTDAIYALITESTIYHIAQEYTQSFDVAGDALFQAEELGDTVTLALAYRRYGVMNATFFQKKESEHYLKLSTHLFYQALRSKKSSPSDVISSYFELVVSQIKFQDYDKAMLYLDTCYLISNQYIDTSSHSYLNTQKGIILLQQGHIDAAIKTLENTAKQFEAISDNDKISIDRKAYLIVIYTHLGEAYKLNHQEKLANNYFNKAFEIPHITKRFDSHKLDLLEKYGAFQYQTGAYQQAYNKIYEADSIKDELFSPRALANNGFLKVRNLYRDKLEQKNEELLLKEKALTRLRTFIYISIALLIAGGLYFRSRNLVKKYKLEKTRAADLLTQKNKELTLSTLKLIEQETLLLKFSEHLKTKESDTEGKALLHSVKNRNVSMWDDFNQRFMAVNSGFYDRLNAQVTGLSPSDIKICALIKLNFSGKEMAQLLGISLASVNTARYRLRKKIGLERDDNLTNFIAQI